MGLLTLLLSLLPSRVGLGGCLGRASALGYKVFGSSCGGRQGDHLQLFLSSLNGEQGLSAYRSGKMPEASCLPPPLPGDRYLLTASCGGIFISAAPPNPLISLDTVSPGPQWCFIRGSFDFSKTSANKEVLCCTWLALVAEPGPGRRGSWAGGGLSELGRVVPSESPGSSAPASGLL